MYGFSLSVKILLNIVHHCIRPSCYPGRFVMLFIRILAFILRGCPTSHHTRSLRLYLSFNISFPHSRLFHSKFLMTEKYFVDYYCRPVYSTQWLECQVARPWNDLLPLTDTHSMPSIITHKYVVAVIELILVELLIETNLISTKLWCPMSAKNQLLYFTISFFGKHN